MVKPDTVEMTPTGFKINPDPHADFPLSRRGQTVTVDGRNITIEPDSIIRGYKAHFRNEPSERVNSYQPEFYYAKAMGIALKDIGNLWRTVTPVDPKDLESWTSHTIYHSHVFQTRLDLTNSHGERFRLMSTYPYLYERMAYSTREEDLILFRLNNQEAISLGVYVPGKETPYPILLNVADPTVTRNSSYGDWFGWIWTDTKKYSPGLMDAKLHGVEVGETRELVSYVESLRDRIKS